MTVLHLAQAHIDMAAFNRNADERGWSHSSKGRPGVFDEGSALHHLTVEMFGQGAFRPFRLMIPPGARSGNLYAYTTSDADALRETVSMQALPDQIAVLSPDRIATKTMPNFREGQRLGFDLRTRPVRRLKRPLGDSFSAGAEVDAFVVEALRNHPDDIDGLAAAERSREEVYVDWLSERLSASATLDRSATRLHAFRRALVVRNGRAREGPDAIMHGTLTIHDPTAFAQALASGVGRHCAYGFGMMLLRAPQSAVPE